MSKKSIPGSEILFQKIRGILEEARNKVYHKANIEMLRAYWNIGREPKLTRRMPSKSWKRSKRGWAEPDMAVD